MDFIQIFYKTDLLDEKLNFLNDYTKNVSYFCSDKYPDINVMFKTKTMNKN